jgi:hypothetical protein
MLSQHGGRRNQAMPEQRPTQPVFRQLMLDMGDDADQLPPPGWRGWKTTSTSTPKAAPQAETGDGKPKPRKPRRTNLAR